MGKREKCHTAGRKRHGGVGRLRCVYGEMGWTGGVLLEKDGQV